MKKRFVLNTLAVLFALSPVIYLAATWNSLPETFVTRFKFAGVVEEVHNKSALMLSTAIVSGAAALLYLALRNLNRLDPKVTESTPRFAFHKLAAAVTVLMTIGNYGFIIAAKTDAIIHFNTVITGIGVIFAIAGNYMNNIKPNYVAGVRLPWTLNDPDNWRRTHHLASKLWFLGGIVLIIISFTVPDSLLIPLVMAMLVVMTVVPGVYSYRIYKSKTNA